MLRLAASRGGGPETRSGTLPAQTSREAAKCCAWQHQGWGPETRSGYRPEPEVLPLPAETGGGPETRLGTVQSLKCCPCQQKQAARLPSAAPGSMGGPRNALGYRPEPEVLPLPAESIKGGGPETRSGTVQSLKCCPCQQKRKGGGPRNALGYRLPSPETRSGTVQSLKCCPCQQKRGGAPKRAWVPSRA